MGLISRVSSRTYSIQIYKKMSNTIATNEVKQNNQEDDLEKLQELAQRERDALTGAPSSAMKMSELQTMPSRQYLDQTVMPLLYNGLERLVEERPPNPVDWLATYLLKNKNQASYMNMWLNYTSLSN